MLKLLKCQAPLLSLHRKGSVSLQDVEVCVQQALLTLEDPFPILCKSRRALKAVASCSQEGSSAATSHGTSGFAAICGFAAEVCKDPHGATVLALFTTG